MNKKNRFIERMIVVLAIFWFNTAAMSQSTEFGVSRYHGVHGTHKFSGERIKNKFGFSFAFYLRRFLDQTATTRFGYRLSINRAEDFASAPTNSFPINRDNRNEYKMVSMLISYQRKLYQANDSILILELAAGPSLISSSSKEGPNQCDTFLCNFPKIRMNFKPGLSYMLKIYRTAALQVAGSHTLLTGGKDEVLPFKSGFRISVSLVLEMERKRKKQL